MMWCLLDALPVSCAGKLVCKATNASFNPQMLEVGEKKSTSGLKMWGMHVSVSFSQLNAVRFGMRIIQSSQLACNMSESAAPVPLQLQIQCQSLSWVILGVHVRSSVSKTVH